jgi:hypothetical protein
MFPAGAAVKAGTSMANQIAQSTEAMMHNADHAIDIFERLRSSAANWEWELKKREIHATQMSVENELLRQGLRERQVQTNLSVLASIPELGTSAHRLFDEFLTRKLDRKKAKNAAAAEEKSAEVDRIKDKLGILERLGKS